MQCKQDFFERNTVVVAKDLLGKEIKIGKQQGIIIETEAYLGKEDEASHAYKGITQRSFIMYQDPGYIYVYLIYGIYYCLNFVCDIKGKAGAVLIRGIFIKKPQIILNGPGKLTRYFAITKEQYHGKSIFEKTSPIQIHHNIKFNNFNKIKATPRIGIKKGTQHLYRFVLEEFIE